ncbi:hypothetical protein N0B40_19035 [Chryseobacterium oranimense]|uniref:hypothetical protein n=1 Tax=Chryseobacterium oranimense TaxID=421058 RepID=UPI0021AF6185|nr:hypothetical protein [Chryseobacterium oranimense]UWX60474.1 hypothetical protein N0B40_19035 [Chryseobacterium oranimense]
MNETIQDGALSLLGETTKILNENNVEYLIVGGWSPFLLNKGKLPHPGTKDVDILFKSGTETGKLKEIIDTFLKNGFTQSAKHPFQLLKVFEIKGYNFVYNVDLLHPDNQEKDPELYIDHIDFPVKESHTMRVDYKGKTILLPKSDFFFNDFITQYPLEYINSNGEKENIEFNLLNEAGLILSKSKSVFEVKRTRDAYDIFLSIKQNKNYDKTIQQLKNISETNPQITDALQNIYTDENLKKIDNNIYDWCSKLDVSEGRRESLNVFEKFFKDLNIKKSSDRGK